MRIQFIIPFINPTGGIRMVFEYANRLLERGHQASIFFPLFPYRFADRLTTPAGLRRWVGDLVLNLRHGANAPWFPLRVPLKMIPWVAGRWLPPADAIIATAWPTAYDVARLPATHGVPFYFIQGFEVWSGPAPAVEASYRLPLGQITVASWLTRTLMERFGCAALDTIPYGVDTANFYPEGEIHPPTGRVLLQYHPLPIKGVADVLEAWEQVRAAWPAAQLVMFGLEKGADVPAFVEFHANPSRDALRALYNSCDIFVSPSWSEGCQLPPMEAMACRCAVVATNVGGIPDYAIAGQTAIVVEPHRPTELAEAIIHLLSDEAARRRVAEAGYQHIQQFTWERAVERFEAALKRGIQNNRGR